MSLKVKINVEFNSADHGQDEAVWSIVKDKLLEMRATLQMLNMVQTTYMHAPVIEVLVTDDFGGRAVDLDREVHSDEAT